MDLKNTGIETAGSKNIPKTTKRSRSTRNGIPNLEKDAKGIVHHKSRK